MAGQGPRNREKHITGTGTGVHRRGSGRGTGPVGSGSFMGSSGGGDNGNRSGGSRSKMSLIIAILVLLLGGGGGLGSMLTQSDSTGSVTDSTTSSSTQQAGSQSASYSASSLGSLFGSVSSTSSGWVTKANTGTLNTSVDSAARDRYTTIKGDGKDQVTVMVYMCGTDLESRSGMATSDLTEMAKATLSDQVNVIVYTGGCKQWKNNIVSSSVNQIYQVKDGGLKCLVSDAGTSPMTDPENLTTFINFCTENYPANRQMLIFWDHGGGTLSGYGYDEKNPSSGSMTLTGINQALSASGTKFDFIGFDACLMATLETDQMLTKYADYCIASEETEPGVGWYYTNWLTRLSADPSLATLNVGQNIADDFVDVCARSCAGQKTTLSVVDLAELEGTLSDDFKAFAQSTTKLIQNNEYQTVSDARNEVREFAQSSRIDQIDLVHFAKGIGTSEAEALADTLLSAVKYNRTSSNMTNAYGISVYFPYQKAGKVDSAVAMNEAIGVDDEYSDCIKEFAALEVSGQISSGGGSVSSPLGALLGSGSSVGSVQDMAQIASLLGSIMGDSGSLHSLIGGSSSFLSGRALSTEDTAAYIESHQLDAGKLVWQEASDGSYYMELDDADWALIHSVDVNMYVDDGEGYIDLGLDNSYTFDDEGRLCADASDDYTWISINNQPVAYYHTDTVEDGDDYTITGYVPALLNGEEVHLILIFDQDHPYGFIAGADPDYDEETETATVSRGLIELQEGDTLDFLCDYYGYDGTFRDSYMLGEQMTVTADMEISDTYLIEETKVLYRFTDIYNQTYWVEVE